MSNRKEYTLTEIEKRFAEIDAQPHEKLTPEDAAALKAAEAEDDGTLVPLEKLNEELDGYSGRLVLRIPKSLHKTLKEEARMEGVSLNQYMLYKLAK